MSVLWPSEYAKIRFRPGLCPGPRWGSSRHSPRPFSRLERGHSSPYSTPLGTDPAAALTMHPPRSPARSTPMLGWDAEWENWPRPSYVEGHWAPVRLSLPSVSYNMCESILITLPCKYELWQLGRTLFVSVCRRGRHTMSINNTMQAYTSDHRRRFGTLHFILRRPISSSGLVYCLISKIYN